MRSPSGELSTQFSLHDAEWLGDIKYDFLVTEISDKIITTLDLLTEDGLVEKDLTLREKYNKYLHPKAMNLDDQRIWQALSSGSVLDVFQFNSAVEFYCFHKCISCLLKNQSNESSVLPIRSFCSSVESSTKYALYPAMRTSRSLYFSGSF